MYVSRATYFPLLNINPSPPDSFPIFYSSPLSLVGCFQVDRLAMVGEDRRESRTTVDCKLTAISSRPVTHGTTHTLSPLDHAMGMHSLHLIFYYHESPFGPLFDFDPAWISLSDTLSFYHPVTGRLTRLGNGKWGVKCNDAGVRTRRAKVVGNTIGEWMKTADAGDEKDLVGWEDLTEDPNIWSPFQIQVIYELYGVGLGFRKCKNQTVKPLRYFINL